MRNPQGCYSMDYYFYKALQTVAYNYGLTYSEYVSRCMLAIVKAEMVNLDISLSEIFSPTDREQFAERELAANFRRLPNGSPFATETKESYIAFKNYIAREFGAVIPEEASAYQMPKSTPQRIIKPQPTTPAPVQRYTSKPSPILDDDGAVQYEAVIKVPEVEEVQKFETPIQTQKETITTTVQPTLQIKEEETVAQVEEEEKVTADVKPVTKKNLIGNFGF